MFIHLLLATSCSLFGYTLYIITVMYINDIDRGDYYSLTEYIVFSQVAN